jgi:hypothetical protein
MRGVLGCSMAMLLASGCGSRSEAELQAEFDAYVAARNACEQPLDCVLAEAGCPLGCVVAVHHDHQRSVEAKADDLIDEYTSGGQHCDYGCLQMKAVCTAGRCEAVPE